MVYSITIWFYTICLKIQTVGHLPSLVRPKTRSCGYRATASRSGEHERPIPSLDLPQIFYFDTQYREESEGERETYNTLEKRRRRQRREGLLWPITNNSNHQFVKFILLRHPNGAGAETLDASVGKIKGGQSPPAEARCSLLRVKKLPARNIEQEISPCNKTPRSQPEDHPPQERGSIVAKQRRHTLEYYHIQ
jgi:hypothetical protein